MRTAGAVLTAAGTLLVLRAVVGPDLRAYVTSGVLLTRGSSEENMNGEFVLGTTPGGKPGLFPKRYADYPGGVQSFDVYSPPMSTLYSQVWLKPLAPVELPAEIIQQFNGTKMAIVGWEIDQVRRTPAGDVSVPITASYNHHYNAVIAGGKATFRKVKVDGPDAPGAEEVRMQHGDHGVAWGEEYYLADSANGGRDVQFITSANGGEYRKSFHGFPPGYAVVIESPRALQISPMQIDTWNRDAMNISGPTPPKFVPGPLPRASLAPTGAAHSGLLECPLTTRVTKVLDGKYATQGAGACAEQIWTSAECFQAAASTLAPHATVNETGALPNRPAGCSVSTSAGTPAYVFFNELVTEVACAADALCVCHEDPKPFGEATGWLLYNPTSQSVDTGKGHGARFWPHKCPRSPQSELAAQQNPTCDIRHYQGGQWGCGHMWSLLDADQEIPWPDQPLEFVHKWRFHVQPYEPEKHTPVSVGPWLLIASPWEYDVPKCADGVPGCTLVNGTWIHTIKGSVMGGKKFVTLNNHCHAPMCLSVRVYACEKGTALEDCNADVGKLICRTDPAAGGTGHPGIAGTRFDEEGYIAIPECLWGAAEHGLEPPIDLNGVPLHVVKLSNATWGHYGEMSGGQPWSF